MDEPALTPARLLPAVTVHRFGAEEGDCDDLAEELTAFFENLRSDLPGLCAAVVLVGYGVGRVAVIAGWESRDAQVAGVSRLRTDPQLLAIASRSGRAEHDEYRTVSCDFSGAELRRMLMPESSA
jgi:hypothetical protein